MLGEEVITLTNKKYKPGTYKIKWDGINSAGLTVSYRYLYLQQNKRNKKE